MYLSKGRSRRDFQSTETHAWAQPCQSLNWLLCRHFVLGSPTNSQTLNQHKQRSPAMPITPRAEASEQLVDRKQPRPPPLFPFLFLFALLAFRHSYKRPCQSPPRTAAAAAAARAPPAATDNTSTTVGTPPCFSRRCRSVLLFLLLSSWCYRSSPCWRPWSKGIRLLLRRRRRRRLIGLLIGFQGRRGRSPSCVCACSQQCPPPPARPAFPSVGVPARLLVVELSRHHLADAWHLLQHRRITSI